MKKILKKIWEAIKSFVSNAVKYLKKKKSTSTFKAAQTKPNIEVQESIDDKINLPTYTIKINGSRREQIIYSIFKTLDFENFITHPAREFDLCTTKKDKIYYILNHMHAFKLIFYKAKWYQQRKKLKSYCINTPPSIYINTKKVKQEIDILEHIVLQLCILKGFRYYLNNENTVPSQISKYVRNYVSQVLKEKTNSKP